MNLINKIVDRVIALSVAVPAVALLSGAFLILAYVIGRRWLGLQWLFVEEYIRYFLVLFVYFPLAYTLKTGGHINVTVVVNRLSVRTRMLLDVVTSIVALGVLIFMIRASIMDWWLPAWTRNAVSMSAVHTPLWIPYLILPLGLGLFSVVLLLHIVVTSMTLAKKTAVEDIKKAVVAEL